MKIEEIVKAVSVELGAEYEVSIQEKIDNNGNIKKGIMIRHIGENISPIIYPNDCDNDVANNIIKAYKNSKVNEFSLSAIKDKESILSHLSARIVNTRKNADTLKNLVHVNVMDLSVTFDICIGDEGYIRVTNQFADDYDLTKEEMLDVIYKNLRNEMYITSMSTMIRSLMNDTDVPDTPDMYVCTNTKKVFGATCLLFPDLFKPLSDKLGDLYILPSSIHEVIIIPATMGDVAEFRDMVCQVNKTVLKAVDYLSDNVYFYHDNTISIA